MNQITKFIELKFTDLEHELNSVCDEAEQDEISEYFVPLDRVYKRIRYTRNLDLEIAFEEKEGYKVYNVHADEATYYIEEYDGFAEKNELEEFMQNSKLRDVTKEVNVIELLVRAFEAEDSGKAKINYFE